MFRFVLLLLLLVATTCRADEIIHDTPQLAIDAAEARIVKLPQDQDRFYFTVLGAKNDARYKDILSWLQSVPELRAFKEQTHFHAIDTEMAIWAARYKPTVPALPCIRVQAADGQTLYQVSGTSVPMTGESLARAVNTECLFRWRRSRPNPDPAPDADPAPNPDTDGEAEPEVSPTPDTKPDESHTLLVLGIIAALAAGLALGGGHAFASNLQQYRANHH